MKRRTFLGSSAAALALPAIARAQSADDTEIHSADRLVVPRSALDDGVRDAQSRLPRLRHAVRHGRQLSDLAADGARAIRSRTTAKLWKLTLRDGLFWHDGERVLARDCVASIKRWSKRDSFGDSLMLATDELVRARRQDDPVPPQEAVPAAAGGAGQGAEPDVRDDARAYRQYRSVQADHRIYRQRSVPIRHQRACARLAQRVREVRQVCAARGRHAGLDGRSENRAFRSG